MLEPNFGTFMFILSINHDNYVIKYICYFNDIAYLSLFVIYLFLFEGGKKDIGTIMLIKEYVQFCIIN